MSICVIAFSTLAHLPMSAINMTQPVMIGQATMSQNMACFDRRPLWATLLHHLAALPPLTTVEVLQTISGRVLHAMPALAPRLQAEPFGDAALAQVRHQNSQEE